MDPVTLAGLAITTLSPYIAEVSKEFATKAGDAAFEQAKRLYDAIHTRFAKEAPKDQGRASEALETFKKDPDNAATVQTKLARILQDDPNFATTLSQIIKTGPLQEMSFGDDASLEDVHQDIERGQYTQSMKAIDRAKFKNVTQNVGPKKEQK